MYPQFLFLGVPVHVFGLALAAGLAMFVWMSHRLALRVGADKRIASDRVLWLVLAAAVVSRLAFFLAEWRDYKWLGSWFQAAFMSQYNLSLAGAVLGFFGLAAWWARKLSPREKGALVDVFALSFLFAATAGYVGAFLGGQVYGVTVALGNPWGVAYAHPATPVPGEAPRFPLALAYAAASFALFCGLYIAHALARVPGLVGHAAVVMFCSVLLVGEFFNGDTDMFKSLTFLDLNQWVGVAGVAWGLRGMLKIAKNG